MTTQTLNLSTSGERLQGLGKFILRYGLVLIIAWIGAMKFTAYEAAAIQPLVESSPLVSWVYNILSVQGVSNIFGFIELSIAFLIVMRPASARLCAVGSLLAIGMFLTTLTFLFTLPGWEPSLGGFPALSSSGQFLIKDLSLLGTAVWSLGEALSSIGNSGK